MKGSCRERETFFLDGNGNTWNIRLKLRQAMFFRAFINKNSTNNNQANTNGSESELLCQCVKTNTNWFLKGFPKKHFCSDRTRWNGLELKEAGFRLGIRRKLFTVRVVRNWHMLPREVVNSLPLKVSKARLSGALSSWSSGRFPPHGRELELGDPYSPFQPKPFWWKNPRRIKATRGNNDNWPWIFSSSNCNQCWWNYGNFQGSAT